MSSLTISKLHFEDLAEPWAGYAKGYATADGFVWVVLYGDRIHGVFPSLQLAEAFLEELQFHLDDGKTPPKLTEGRARSMAFEIKKQAQKAALKNQGNTHSDPSSKF